MNKYEYVAQTKVNNYMVKAKHIESTSSKLYSKPTPSKEAQYIIAANQNNQPIYIKPKTDVEGLHEAYNRQTHLYIHVIHYISQALTQQIYKMMSMT